MNLLLNAGIMIGIACLSSQSLFAGLISSTPSMKEYENGAGKLLVYTDVPGHATLINGRSSRAKSDVYEIRVRSAATDNEWVQCFASMTYNRAKELPPMKAFATPTSSHAYQKFTAGWTHTYANIEMSEGAPVEVEIRKIGDTPFNGASDIIKSAVHPVQKVISGSKRDDNGRVYFKINKPCQIVIDINGQMDDHNAAFPSTVPGGAMKGNPPVHSVALYANPILPKPVAGPDHKIVTVNPGDSSPTSLLKAPEAAAYDTLVFAPGVHNIGAFKVHPGKGYYIPGDAILYGSMDNSVDKGKYRCNGDSIRIYGYGTICGVKTPHYQNCDNNPEYPEWNAADKDKRGGGVGLSIRNAWDIKITGITIADPANFNTRIDGQRKRTNDKSLMSWVKLHSWRVNGDGCGGYIPIEDSFLRTSDDSTYVRDWRRRCTFWKDTNANQFRHVNHIAGGVEDCDILYSRWRDPKGVGNVFEFATSLGGKPGEKPLKLTIRNNRFHDKLSNPKHLINLDAAETFTGLTFENMAYYLPLNKKLSVIKGSKEAPYTGKVMFKNITFQNGLDGSEPVKLTQRNYKDYFETNEFVDKSIFE
jgi:hypothetical protein